MRIDRKRPRFKMGPLKNGALSLLRQWFGIEIYRRNSYPWGEAQLWQDVARLLLAARDLRRPAVAVDVGAYRGDTLKRIESLADWNEIHAFEPFPLSFKHLQYRFRSQRNIILHNSAVSAETGTARLHLTKSDQSNSLLEPAEDATMLFKQHTAFGQVNVSTTTLDAVSEEYGLDHSSFLKLDVQGAEYDVLRGAACLLDQQRIDVILCETEFIELYKDQPLFCDLVRHLSAYGFGLFGIYSPRPDQHGRIAWADSIFYRNELLAKVI